jgi:predicted ATPase
MIRRIGLYGGPGCGKTTLAHWLVSQMKEAHLTVEYVHEYIKPWAYQGRVPKGWDQKTVFDRQMEEELKWLTIGVDHIVTDSPLLLQVAYMKRDRLKYHDPCLALAKLYDRDHPSLNIFLCRDGLPYQSHGRYESLEAARSMDEVVRSVLDEHADRYSVCRTVDRDAIRAAVLEAIGK